MTFLREALWVIVGALSFGLVAGLIASAFQLGPTVGFFLGMIFGGAGGLGGLYISQLIEWRANK